MPTETFEFEFLGTGTSLGVPIPTCRCPACVSADPRNVRWRSSALIRHRGKNIVIDCGPEFRLQCLRAAVDRLDGVLVTHKHTDHIAGIDDIRAFTLPIKGTHRENMPPIGVWGNADTVDAIRNNFSYIWNPIQIGGGLPKISLHVAPEEFELAGLRIRPIPIMHGILGINGYRVGRLAYMTDISKLPETSAPLVKGVDCMVISFVNRQRHETHLSLDEAIALHRRIRPKQTYLTHLAHYFSHEQLASILPDGMTPAYDGLKITVAI